MTRELIEGAQHTELAIVARAILNEVAASDFAGLLRDWFGASATFLSGAGICAVSLNAHDAGPSHACENLDFIHIRQHPALLVARGILGIPNLRVTARQCQFL